MRPRCQVPIVKDAHRLVFGYLAGGSGGVGGDTPRSSFALNNYLKCVSIQNSPAHVFGAVILVPLTW